MVAKSSRSSLLLLLPLIIILFILLLGCAPCCCCWPGSYRDLKGLDNGNGSGATVTGTALLDMNGSETPVPEVKVTLSKHSSTTADYETTTDAEGYFRISGITAGTYFIRIAGGDLGWSDTINVKKNATMDLGDILLHPTLPPPGNITTDKYPATPEDVIKAYYKAINNGDYTKAMSFISGQLSNTDANTMQAQYEPYVKNIEVVSIDRTADMDYNGRQVYFVTFTAEYIQHYPAGSGNLPQVHAMQKIGGKWMIVDIGTG